MLTSKLQNRRPSTKSLVGTLFAAMFATLFVGAQPVFAQASHLRISQSALGKTQSVEVGQNKSIIIDLPIDVREVIVSQPAVANVVLRSKRRAIIQGVNDGETNIFFLDGGGRTISVLELAVKSPPSRVGRALQDAIADILPGSNIKVSSVILEGASSEVNRVVLSGTARSTDDIARATQIAVQYAGSEQNVANVVQVSGAQQVALKVTVAEVSRETVKQLGINLSGSLNIGNLATSLSSAPSMGGASSVVGSNTFSAGGTFGPLSLKATLQALQRRGAIRTLAEPTLTTLSGKEAEFLAGGEFPVQTRDADGVVTTDFKRFGVNLKFTPTVMSSGLIELEVETSVSELSTGGGISERKAKTTVHMYPGSTLAIAGLIEEKVRQQFNSIPGIDSVPILGALFRSRDFIRSETELLILITPMLVQAGGPVSLPTDRMVFAGDAESIFLGHMEKLYGVGGNAGSGNYTGSVGFVLD